MSSTTTFNIACKDEISIPAVSKPFEVTIENFDRDFKEIFDDVDKLQSFIQAQVDEKFSSSTSNSRDRDHARAENPKVSVEEGGNVAVFNLTFTWQNNDDAANVTTVSETWKVNLKTKEVISSSSAQQQQQQQAAAVTTTNTTTSSSSNSESLKQPKKEESPVKQQQQQPKTEEVQQQQQQPSTSAPAPSPTKKEALPTAALGPASPDTPNEPAPKAEEKKEGGGCVIQ